MATVGENITSIAWGNKSFPVTQEFGVYNPKLAHWYQYAADVGWPAGTHVGIDVGVPFGTDIHAVEAGRVEQSGFSNSFRPFPIYIREDDGDLAIYGHLSQNFVSTGERVKSGELIGKSGEQTEWGTTIPDDSGPHIHYELRDASGKAIDPVPELAGTIGSLSGSGRSDLLKGFTTGGLSAAIPILVIGGGIAALLFGIGMVVK